MTLSIPLFTTILLDMVVLPPEVGVEVIFLYILLYDVL